VFSDGAACHIDWLQPDSIAGFAPARHHGHLFGDVLPALRARGVTEDQIETLLVASPRRYLSGPSGA
jgi:phosphotriesterase-related protein